MQIQVLTVQYVGREMRVHFRSEWGEGEARWVGPTPTPESHHDVELDIPEALRWGASIRPILESQPMIATSINGTRLVAQLHAAEADSDAVLRLGQSLVLAEAYGEPPAPGTWVQVRTAKLILYPFVL